MPCPQPAFTFRTGLRTHILRHRTRTDLRVQGPPCRLGKPKQALEHEADAVGNLHRRLLKSLNDHKGFWRRVDGGQLRPEVVPSAPAALRELEGHYEKAKAGTTRTQGEDSRWITYSVIYLAGRSASNLPRVGKGRGIGQENRAVLVENLSRCGATHTPVCRRVLGY